MNKKMEFKKESRYEILDVPAGIKHVDMIVIDLFLCDVEIRNLNRAMDIILEAIYVSTDAEEKEVLLDTMGKATVCMHYLDNKKSLLENYAGILSMNDDF